MGVWKIIARFKEGSPLKNTVNMMDARLATMMNVETTISALKMDSSRRRRSIYRVPFSIRARMIREMILKKTTMINSTSAASSNAESYSGTESISP